MQAEPLSSSLELAVKYINLYLKSDNTEFVHFKQDGAISTLSGN